MSLTLPQQSFEGPVLCLLTGLQRTKRPPTAFESKAEKGKVKLIQLPFKDGCDKPKHISGTQENVGEGQLGTDVKVSFMRQVCAFVSIFSGIALPV